jgi:hypothetical protein
MKRLFFDDQLVVSGTGERERHGSIVLDAAMAGFKPPGHADLPLFG